MDALGLDVSATASIGSLNQPRQGTSFAELDSEDFLKLLVAQLTNQDPLEPTGNEELLRQIASIREIELSTALTSSLSKLTGNQRFGSASTLIGRFITSVPGADGTITSGIVSGVRFAADGTPMLQLANGGELSMDNISTIEPLSRAGEALIGRAIVGIDRRDASNPKMVEGIVTSVRVNEQDEVMLELDSGEDLRLRDYSGLGSIAA